MGPDAPEEVFTEKTGSWTFNRKVKRFSAKSFIVESKFLQISFTYANRSGPNALPCGTPGVTDFLR